jgi:hypothetical protein
MKGLLILAAVVGVVVYLKTRKAPTQAVAKAPAGSVAAGGRPSWEDTAIAGAFGIAATQIGNIFGGSDSGPSPAANPDININAD